MKEKETWVYFYESCICHLVHHWILFILHPSIVSDLSSYLHRNAMVCARVSGDGAHSPDTNALDPADKSSRLFGACSQRALIPANHAHNVRCRTQVLIKYSRMLIYSSTHESNNSGGRQRMCRTRKVYYILLHAYTQFHTLRKKVFAARRDIGKSRETLFVLREQHRTFYIMLLLLRDCVSR